mgnify:CR=1 FL=1
MSINTNNPYGDSRNHHILSVLVQNRPGVLARVSGLFARRGYNIFSLAVAPTEDDDFSRITIVVDISATPLEQIVKQLFKLIDVVRITELDPRKSVERELIVATVRADGDSRGRVAELEQQCNALNGQLASSGQPDQVSRLTADLAAAKDQLAAAKGEVDNVAQTQARTASDLFFDSLAKAIPTWQQVQATEECQEFLQTRVPGTRATWDQALKQAAADRDVDAVVEVFQVFFEKHPALNPAMARAPWSGPTPAVPPAPSAPTRRQFAAQHYARGCAAYRDSPPAGAPVRARRRRCRSRPSA